MAINKITILGSGNVAEALGSYFLKAGLDTFEVFSRNEKTGKALAGRLKAKFQPDSKKLKIHAGLYLIAVPDNSIKSVANKLDEKLRLKAKLVHTSGATKSTVLKSCCENFGVFYPLQTFTKGRRISSKEFPICITASSSKLEKELYQLGKQLSDNVHVISDAERASLHVAAVVVNNFTNHLLTLGTDYLEKQKLPADLLNPLIKETVNKALKFGPKNSQTGPAKRGDQKSIDAHLRMLKKNPELSKIYQLLSSSIEKYYNPKS